MVRKGFKYIGSIDVLYGGYKKVIKRLMYFFFLSGFSFTHIHNSQDSRGRGRLSI